MEQNVKLPENNKLAINPFLHYNQFIIYYCLNI